MARVQFIVIVRMQRHSNRLSKRTSCSTFVLKSCDFRGSCQSALLASTTVELKSCETFEPMPQCGRLLSCWRQATASQEESRTSTAIGTFNAEFKCFSDWQQSLPGSVPSCVGCETALGRTDGSIASAMADLRELSLAGSKHGV